MLCAALPLLLLAFATIVAGSLVMGLSAAQAPPQLPLAAALLVLLAPGSQHAGEKRGVAGLLLGRTERAARAADPRPLSLLQRGLAPRSKGKARAELRPARRQSRLPHSRSLLLPGRER